MDGLDARVLAALAGSTEQVMLRLRLSEFVESSPDVLACLAPPREQDKLALAQALTRCWLDRDQSALLEVLVQVFAPQRIVELPRAGTGWPEPLVALPEARVFGVGPSRDGLDYARLVIWLAAPGPSLSDVRDAQAEAAVRKRHTAITALPPILVGGPGARGLGFDPERGLSILREFDLHWTISQPGRLGAAIDRAARVRGRLRDFSPFQFKAALPPGSPLFVGRDAELDYIEANVGAHSVLIVGARQIGETSLLNQVGHRVEKREDLVWVQVDLQGLREPYHHDFAARLAGAARRGARGSRSTRRSARSARFSTRWWRTLDLPVTSWS